MICAPITTLTRDSVRRLLLERPDLIERGLRLELADLDFSQGRLGPVDALCRDASGRAVLLFVTDSHDQAVVARVAVALGFLRRNGRAMARSLPAVKAQLSAPCRVLVLGSDLGDELVGDLARLGHAELQVLGIEAFRIGKSEHFAVRSQHGEELGATAANGLVPAARLLWDQLESLMSRLDPAVRIDGDRYSRTVSCQGAPLGSFWLLDGRIEGALADGATRVLANQDEVRQFVDSALRQLLAAAPATVAGNEVSVAVNRAIAPGLTLGALRASLSASRLSREEFSALGELAGEGEAQNSG